jgi:hypothetical protein
LDTIHKAQVVLFLSALVLAAGQVVMVHTQEAGVAVELVAIQAMVGEGTAIMAIMDPLLQPLPALVVQVAVVRAELMLRQPILLVVAVAALAFTAKVHLALQELLVHIMAVVAGLAELQVQMAALLLLLAEVMVVGPGRTWRQLAARKRAVVVQLESFGVLDDLSHQMRHNLI